ncbi:MAG: protein disulfide oxidoreductase [Exilispira sp.]
MSIFDQKTTQHLTQLLSQIVNPIKINFWTQEFECPTCNMNRKFLEEFSSFNNKIKLNIHDFVKEKELADKYNIDKIPAIIVSDENENNMSVRFYGIPAGYEINSFIAACLEFSKPDKIDDIEPEIIERIKKIDKKIHIQVFVTLTCPYCPSAVAVAHRIALINPNITSDMIESSTFTPLAIKYNVSSVPKTIINDKIEFVGAQPINVLVETIEKL